MVESCQNIPLLAILNHHKKTCLKPGSRSNPPVPFSSNRLMTSDHPQTDTATWTACIGVVFRPGHRGIHFVRFDSDGPLGVIQILQMARFDPDGLLGWLSLKLVVFNGLQAVVHCYGISHSPAFRSVVFAVSCRASNSWQRHQVNCPGSWMLLSNQTWQRFYHNYALMTIHSSPFSTFVLPLKGTFENQR